MGQVKKTLDKKCHIDIIPLNINMIWHLCWKIFLQQSFRGSQAVYWRLRNRNDIHVSFHRLPMTSQNSTLLISWVDIRSIMYKRALWLRFHVQANQLNGKTCNVFLLCIYCDLICLETEEKKLFFEILSDKRPSIYYVIQIWGPQRPPHVIL